MKNFLKMCVCLALLGGVSSCKYDDDELWDKVHEMDGRVESLEKAVAGLNDGISALRKVVDALNQGKVIVNVEQLEDGYRLTFSDQSSVVLKHGADGQDAPVIGVKAEADGVYYWTQTLQGKTSWLLDDKGQKMPVKGADGVAGVTPKMGVDTDGFWTADMGKGPVRIVGADGQPVKAVPEKAEALFQEVREEADRVVLTLANGTVLNIPKLTPLSVAFTEGDGQTLKPGETKELALTAVGMDYGKVLEVTEGWKAELSYTKASAETKAVVKAVLKVTAPAKLTEVNRQAEIHILVSDEAGQCKLSKLHVLCAAYELRVLTFEDADARFTPYDLGYCGRKISKWSDLIDDPQYGGPMLYADYSKAEYTWWDEGNTELMHTFPYNYQAFCYWGGGHAISHYNSSAFAKFGDHNNQLTVYNRQAGKEMMTTGGGHNGSANFAMHFGYKDGSAFNQTEFLPALVFADGQARVIDHLYVNNSTYAINCYKDGNGLTDKIGPDDWVKLVAIGLDDQGEKTGETTLFMCQGPENIVQEWTKWDLSVLGPVVSVEFNVTGSSDNGYGFSQPAYFAYDDVCVRF